MSDPTSVKNIDWWHSIPLPGAGVTDGRKSLAEQKQEAEFIPSDLAGKTVLDVGAWDGYFSFVAEDRGAARVVAIDNLGGVKDPEERKEQAVDRFGLGTQGFKYAREARDSDAEFVVGDGQRPPFRNAFDVVVCFGVLYHVPDPERLIDQLAGLTREALCLETGVVPSPLGRPKLADSTAIPWRWLYDNSNTFFPTVPWVREQLHAHGFEIRREQSQIDRNHPIRKAYDTLLPFEQDRLFPGRYICEAIQG